MWVFRLLQQCSWGGIIFHNLNIFVDLSSPEYDAMMSQNARHQPPSDTGTDSRTRVTSLCQHLNIFIKIPYIFLLVPIQHIGKTSFHYTSFFTLSSFFFMLGKTMGRFGIWWPGHGCIWSLTMHTRNETNGRWQRQLPLSLGWNIFSPVWYV